MSKGNQSPLTQEARKELLLEAAAYAPSLRKACEIASTNYSTGKYWFANDEEFRAKFLMAMDEGRDRLERLFTKEALRDMRVQYSTKASLFGSGMSMGRLGLTTTSTRYRQQSGSYLTG